MNAPWQFGDLKMFGYDLIVADPPWDFALFSEAGEGKSAKAHYGTMPLDAIAALRVGDLARGDCLLLLWCCEWMAPQPGGRLTAILPATARYDHGLLDGEWDDLPVGSFSESGTNINTTLLTIHKTSEY